MTQADPQISLHAPIEGVTPPAAGTPVPTPEAEFEIPEAYRDKPYLEGVKSQDDLFKKLDWSMSTIGKRPAEIPQDNAPQEKWDAFNKSFGVPDTAEGYEFTSADKASPESQTLQKGMAEAFHAAGVSKRQFQKIESAWGDVTQKVLDQQTAKADQVFDTLAQETFGDKADEKIGVARGLLNDNIPENLKSHLSSIPSEHLVVLAGVINNIADKYISRDSLPKAGVSVGADPAKLDEKTRIEEGTKIMAGKAYNDEWHPEHEAAVAKARQLFGVH